MHRALARPFRAFTTLTLSALILALSPGLECYQALAQVSGQATQNGSRPMAAVSAPARILAQPLNNVSFFSSLTANLNTGALGLSGYLTSAGASAQALGARAPAVQALAPAVAAEIAAAPEAHPAPISLAASIPAVVAEALYPAARQQTEKRPAAAALSQGAEQLSLAHTDADRTYALARIFGEKQRGLAAEVPSVYAQGAMALRGAHLAAASGPMKDAKGEPPTAAAAQQETKPYYTTNGLLLGGLLPVLSAVGLAIILPHLGLGVPMALVGAAGGGFLLAAAYAAIYWLPGKLRQLREWYDSTGAPTNTLIDLSSKFEKGKNRVSIKTYPFKRVILLFAPYKKLMLQATALMILAAVAQIAMPPIFRDLTAAINSEKNAGWLVHLLTSHILPSGISSFLASHFMAAVISINGALLIGLLLVQYSLNKKIGWLMTYIGSAQMKGLGKVLIGHALRLRMDFFQKKRSGDVVAVIDNNVYNFRFGATDMFTNTIQQVVILVPCLFLMFHVSPILAVVSVILNGFGLGAIAGLYRMDRNAVYQAFYKVKNILTGILTEIFGNINLIKIIAGEDRQVKRYEALAEDTYMNHGMKIANVTSKQNAMESTFTYAVTMIIGILGMILVAHNLLTFSGYLAVTLISAFVQRSMQTIAGNWSKLGDSQASFGAIGQMLDTPPENYNADQPALPPLAGHIELKNLHFAYPSVPDTLVIKNLSLNIPAGHKIAFVGFSGSGKSTLAGLIEKLNSPTGATMTFKEKDQISEVSPGRLVETLEDIEKTKRKVLEISDTPIRVYTNGDKKPLVISAKDFQQTAKDLAAKDILITKVSGASWWRRASITIKTQGRKGDWAVPVSEIDRTLASAQAQGLELVKRVDYPHGQVLVDGHDIETVNLHSYRNQFGYVLQTSVIFSGTLEDNFRLGKENATAQEIEQAAKNANAYNFIKDDLGKGSFEKGLQTVVGERGVRLSGGQAQRLSIARAFLADPRVLILDEPTANLDAASESLVMEALYKLMANRTTIIIAHRLSTIQQADTIVFLEQGEIRESGTFNELNVPGTRFHEFIEIQQLEGALAEKKKQKETAAAPKRGS